MSSPDGVLAAIDACLEDYSVSDDAMRWAPDEPEPAQGDSGPHAHLTSGWPIMGRSDGTGVPWDGRCVEWRYAITIDPVVVETRRPQASPYP